MKKIFLLILFSCLLFKPALAFSAPSDFTPVADIVFKARVNRILEERIIKRDDGSSSVQQNLELIGLNNQWKSKTIVHYGISEIDVPSSNNYRINDIVLVSAVNNNENGVDFFVTDFVRTKYLYWLAFIFALVIIIIGKSKGVKSIISLVISFVIIMSFIIPRIIAGDNPLLIGVLGSLMILAVIIYLTEGWNKKSHVAILSVLISLLLTFGLSSLFVYLTRLTGMAQEETIFLIGADNGQINFRGLLLTGILIGAVGVLDDIIIGQIEAVKQIKKLNPNLSLKETYRAGYKIGNTHLGAIVNTLFLTYAGVSLPLLLLTNFGNSGHIPFEQVINNELIATEIIRTLVGSIGVALSMPIATFLAALLLKPNDD
ncbi:MAG: YibE/F family protein [bacterium]|nr:YibE/F family protein [bacterium]